MKPNLDIIYRDLPQHPELNQMIEARINRLERFLDSRARSQITISVPHRHRKTGRDFNVSVDVIVGGRHLNVSRLQGNVYTAISQAFESLTRQVKKTSGKKRSRRHNITNTLSLIAEEVSLNSLDSDNSELDTDYIETSETLKLH